MLFCRRCVLNTLPQRKDNDAETAVVVHKELCDFLKTRRLKIFHQNVNGLSRKQALIQTLLIEVKNKFETFGISETRLHDEVIDSEIRVDGYTSERSDRPTGSGDGVGCYIRNDICYHRWRDLERDGIESLWIEVFRNNSRSILFCILYRSPDTSRHLHKNFQEKLDE